MATITERRFKAVPLRLFTVDGTVAGKIELAKTYPLKVKQIVRINAVGQPQLILEVKRVDSATVLYVGPCKGSIDSRTDLTLYTVASSASIQADEQNRTNVPEQEIPRNVYEEEPTLAIRVKPVDRQGDCYTTENPFPVQLSDGSINIGTVNAELEVQLSHQDNVPDAGDVHDSVRIGDGVDLLAVNPDGSINVVATISESLPTTPLIQEISALLANTEYSASLPAGTKRFSIKSRSGIPKLNLSYVLGAVTTSGFITVHPGNSYDVISISFPAGKTVYFSSSKPNQIIEVESWT